MRNQASLTAEYMALFRALESLRTGTARLFSDPIAPAFLTGSRRWAYRAAHVPHGLKTVERFVDYKTPGARAAGIARTRWIDDHVISTVPTVTQLVLLGAGFDSRPYRLSPLQQLNVFEVDHPVTSQFKQAALKRAIRSIPDNVKFVAIDFDRESLPLVLAGAGWDRQRPTCFLWEGVTNYLSDEAVDAVLRHIGQSVPGTLLFFTYIHRGVLDNPQDFLAADKLIHRVQSYGEPWRFGLYPEMVPGFLEQRGLQLMEDVGVAEVWQGFRRPMAAFGGMSSIASPVLMSRDRALHHATYLK